jgi:hypothetical protein
VRGKGKDDKEKKNERRKEKREDVLGQKSEDLSDDIRRSTLLDQGVSELL